jgi:hypothetical protein
MVLLVFLQQNRWLILFLVTAIAGLTVQFVFSFLYTVNRHIYIYLGLSTISFLWFSRSSFVNLSKDLYTPYTKPFNANGYLIRSTISEKVLKKELI